MRWLLLFLGLPLCGQNYASYQGTVVSRISFLRDPCAQQKNCFGDPTLVGYWPLAFPEEKAYDYSGNGNEGTWNGTPSGTRSYYSSSNGIGGPWAGAFDGATNYITTSSIQLLGGNTVTVAGWIRTMSLSTQYPMFSNRNPSGAIYFGISGSSVFLYCNACNSGIGMPVSGGTVDIAEWSFIAAVISPSSVDVYLDGTNIAHTSASVPDMAAGYVWIGYDTACCYFNGNILGVRGYSVSLNPLALQQIYNCEGYGKCSAADIGWHPGSNDKPRPNYWIPRILKQQQQIEMLPDGRELLRVLSAITLALGLVLLWIFCPQVKFLKPRLA